MSAQVVSPDAYASPHFKYGEFFVSSSYPAIAATLVDMIRVPHAQAIRWLCMTLLEPARVHFDVPFVIESGFRTHRLNELVNGSDRSQHRVGEAADVSVVGMDLEDVCDWIAANCAYGFGQLRLYLSKGIFHISLPTINHQGQYKVIP